MSIVRTYHVMQDLHQRNTHEPIALCDFHKAILVLMPGQRLRLVDDHSTEFCGRCMMKRKKKKQR